MKKFTLTAKEKKQINKAVHEAVKKTYYESIPLDEIFDACKSFGAVPLMEDQTEWAGWLLGGVDKTEHVLFDLGHGVANDLGRYEIVSNTCLSLSYYKMGSGKFEILAYVS